MQNMDAGPPLVAARERNILFGGTLRCTGCPGRRQAAGRKEDGGLGAQNRARGVSLGGGGLQRGSHTEEAPGVWDTCAQSTVRGVERQGGVGRGEPVVGKRAGMRRAGPAPAAAARSTTRQQEPWQRCSGSSVDCRSASASSLLAAFTTPFAFGGEGPSARVPAPGSPRPSARACLRLDPPSPVPQQLPRSPCKRALPPLLDQSNQVLTGAIRLQLDWQERRW